MSRVAIGRAAVAALLDLPASERAIIARALLIGTGLGVARDVGAVQVLGNNDWSARGWNACHAATWDGGT